MSQVVILFSCPRPLALCLPCLPGPLQNECPSQSQTEEWCESHRTVSQKCQCQPACPQVQESENGFSPTACLSVLVKITHCLSCVMSKRNVERTF